MSVNKVNTDGSLSRIAGGTLYADAPIGAIISYGGTTAPSGWLLCQGQAISRTTYADLFKAIGTAFGAGDGSTTFNVPDLREATTKGVGLSGKSSSHYDSDGVALGEFINDRLQDHTHTTGFGITAGSQWAFRADADADKDGGTSGVRAGRSGATTEVKAVGVNYIIKALQVGVPQNVLDYLAPKDITSQCVRNTSTCSNLKVTRSGNVVSVYFVSVAGTAVANATMATGLPLPSDGVLHYGTQVYGSGSIVYTRVEANGSVIGQCHASYVGTGSITYITSD